MPTTPEDIQLDPEQKRLLGELAARSEKPWQQVLREFLEERLRASARAENETNPKPRRQAGSAKGKIWMAPDVDESLEEFKDSM